MKSFSPQRFVIIIFLMLAVVLAACERQLDQNGDATVTPAAPVLDQPSVPTTDPALAPTTDPALAPTTDPALAPTTDPALAPTTDPNVNVQATPASTGQTTHVVAANETLSTIAQQYNLTVDQLAAANNIDPNSVLNLGQILIIPAASAGAQPTVAAGAQPTTTAGERVHIVQAGENLYRIGLLYGFTYQELAAYNNIPNPDRIAAGDTILIPPGGNP